MYVITQGYGGTSLVMTQGYALSTPAPLIDADTLIIDLSPQVLQIDVGADTLIVDLSPDTVTIG